MNEWFRTHQAHDAVCARTRLARGFYSGRWSSDSDSSVEEEGSTIHVDKMRNRLYHFLRYFPNIDVIREQNYDKRKIDICNNFGKIKKKL